LLVKLSEDMDREAAEKALRQAENMPEVDFADPVVGPYDLVMMVETADSPAAVAGQVAKLPWVKSVDTLKLVNSLERHRSAA
jgi:hypothetical protein